jgi:hypothetical protein
MRLIRPPFHNLKSYSALFGKKGSGHNYELVVGVIPEITSYILLEF